MKKTVSRIGGGLESYLKRIFGLMTGAVLVTALTTFIMLETEAVAALISNGGLSIAYYIIVFAGFGLSIWAQMRAFSMKPSTAALLLFLYAIFMGIAITPMIL